MWQHLVKGENMINEYDSENFNSTTLNNQNSISQIDADEDALIDLSEIPEWTDEMFAKARRGHFYLPQK